MALEPINNGDGGAETRYKMNQIIDAFGAVDADVLADMVVAQAATEAAAIDAAAAAEQVVNIAEYIPADNPDAGAAVEFADDDGIVAADITGAGVFRAHGFAPVDADGNEALITGDGDNVVVTGLNIGSGAVVDTIDDAGYSFVVTDENDAVIFEVANDAAEIGSTSLASEMDAVNAGKTRYTSRRPAVLGVIFDDLTQSDEWVMDLFESYGLRCGFAMNTANVNVDTIQLYQRAYLRGHSILSHSTDATAMSSAPADQDAIDAVELKMRNSRSVLESYGFKVSGWVTPNSVLHADYFAVLRKYYGYAFTYSSALGWNSTIDPTSLARKGIETLLDTDNGTFGGHNVDAVTDDMDSAATSGFMRFYYHHIVADAPGITDDPYYTNADLTPRGSAAELTSIVQHLASLKETGAAMILPPDEALQTYYRTPFA